MPQTASHAFRKLGTKLVLVATTLLLVALVAIGLTLLVSWNLEGGAAAVNQAGKERMRAYRIALLLAQAELPTAQREQIYQYARNEMRAFEEAMHSLKNGEPSRPMFLPAKPEIQDRFKGVERTWYAQIKPSALALMRLEDQRARDIALVAFGQATQAYVNSVDALVYAIERDISASTTLLRSLQMGLIGLSVMGTVALIYLMFLLVIRPVNRLKAGMHSMESGNFSTRLPIETRDEFGSLAAGFNHMAVRLQDMYENLAAKVAQKTQSLERQNRELSTISEVAALFNRPGTLEDTCRDFLRKLIRTMDADAGAVRLTEQGSDRIHMYVHENLDSEFARDKACTHMGECLCGEVAQERDSVVKILSNNPSLRVQPRCSRTGYRTVSVFSIQFKDRVLGIFNLFFRKQRDFDESERLMLESLGQQLGVAIANQRLVAREKEMAVSEERNLLAQELHDSIAQSLAFLNLQAQMLGDSLDDGDVPEARSGLLRMSDGIQESYDDVRELLVYFRTRFGESDVETAIRTLLDRFESDTGIETTFRPAGSGVPMSPEIQIQALHIVQECLSNARKHSGAKNVAVTLNRGPVYEFRITDDGCGFEPGKRKEGHVGLAIMHERAQRIGGDVTIESKQGRGTSITLTLPIVQEAAA